MNIEDLRHAVEGAKRKASSFRLSRNRWGIAAALVGGGLTLVTITSCTPAPKIETPTPVSMPPAPTREATITPSPLNSILDKLRDPSKGVIEVWLYRNRDTDSSGLVHTPDQLPIALCPNDSIMFQIKYDKPTQGEGFTVSSSGFGNVSGNFNDRMVMEGLYVNSNKPDGDYEGTATVECTDGNAVTAAMIREYKIHLLQQAPAYIPLPGSATPIPENRPGKLKSLPF